MVVEPSDPREVQRLKEELELLIFELRLVGVPADVVTPWANPVARSWARLTRCASYTMTRCAPLACANAWSYGASARIYAWSWQ